MNNDAAHVEDVEGLVVLLCLVLSKDSNLLSALEGVARSIALAVGNTGLDHTVDSEPGQGSERLQALRVDLRRSSRSLLKRSSPRIWRMRNALAARRS